jgi:PQQ-like domain
MVLLSVRYWRGPRLRPRFLRWLSRNKEQSHGSPYCEVCMTKGHAFWSILMLLLAFGLGGCIPASIQYEPTTSPLPGESRQIGDNTLKLRELWRKSGVRISGSPYDSPDLLVARGRVVCRLYYSGKGSFGLQVFNAADGSLLWKLQEQQPDFGLVAADAKQVYAMVGFKIFAYDLKDGLRLWESQELPSHRNYGLRSDGQKLYVRDTTKDNMYYLDVNTGETLSVSPLSTGDNFRLLAQFPQFDVHTSNRAVRAVDRTTHKALWTTDIGGIWTAPQLPMLLDNMLLVGIWDQVLAIDVQTGQVKWRNQDTPFASSFVMMSGYLYALDYNARLVQLDVKTGQEKGHIQFMPARTSVSDKRYWVAADGQMLFVSFEDSQELIALGP